MKTTKRDPFYSPIAGDIFLSPEKGFIVVDYKNSVMTACTSESGWRGGHSYTAGFGDLAHSEKWKFVCYSNFTCGSGTNEHGFTKDVSVVVTTKESVEWLKQALIQEVINQGWKDTLEDMPEDVTFSWLTEIFTK